MDSDEGSFLTQSDSGITKRSSQFLVADSLYSLSKSETYAAGDVTKFMRNIILCVLCECMDELSILRSINLQNDLGPNSDKRISYISIEDRYMGQENHAECRINSTNNNFDKLAKDINSLYVIFKETCREVRKFGKFTALEDAVKIINLMHSEEIQLLLDEQEKEEIIEDLKNQYEEERLENIRTIENTDNKIQKLRFQGEDIYIYGEYEVNYFNKWENARLEQNDMKCKGKENHYSSIIKDMKEKIRLEERCHSEFVKYLEDSKNDDLEEIQYWMKQYDEELEQKENDILNLKTDLEKIIEERKIMTERYEQRAAAIRDWLEYQRIKDEKEQQKIKEITAATLIQSWWRGVMVRRKLGPSRKKKKGKGKEKKKK